MAAAVKKTIFLPAELARDAEAWAKAEGKTLSAVIQDALRSARVDRRLQELRGIQAYWSRKARERGLLTEQDLERYLDAVKVVFDTNVLVSALVFPGGRGEEALSRIIPGTPRSLPGSRSFSPTSGAW